MKRVDNKIVLSNATINELYSLLDQVDSSVLIDALTERVHEMARQKAELDFEKRLVELIHEYAKFKRGAGATVDEEWCDILVNFFFLLVEQEWNLDSAFVRQTVFNELFK